jgi:hypothetical protein
VGLKRGPFFPFFFFLEYVLDLWDVTREKDSTANGQGESPFQ